MTSIFEKESFTLKELCGIFKNNDISECYINFSSGNNNYRHFLNKARNTKENILYSDEYKKYISFREILQSFDPEFNKLIIRIKTDPRNYDIILSWTELEEKIKGLKKDDLKKLI